MPASVDTRDDRARALLARYRERIAGVLRISELESPSSLAMAHHAAATLIDDLTHDIMRFYVRDRRGELTALERDEVMPCLERLRDILRHRREGPQDLRDRLRKAANAAPQIEGPFS